VTDRVVLLGHHIGYSASPAMHDAAFAALGIDARYELADVPPPDLPGAVGALRGPDRLGANVTQPHKLAVLDLVDERSATVERVGAANTIVWVGDRLVADNTDVGAIAAELASLAGSHGGHFDRALVLGNGGAARAAVAALEDLGCRDVSTLTRVSWMEMAERLGPADLLVNATPIGTASDESPVPATLLRPDLAVLDLVYRPVATRLVRDARGTGAAAASGFGVLLRQGAASFERWTGRAAPIDVMRDALRRELGVTADA
jgi:shikimate dehydrogenase